MQDDQQPSLGLLAPQIGHLSISPLLSPSPYARSPSSTSPASPDYGQHRDEPGHVTVGRESKVAVNARPFAKVEDETQRAVTTPPSPASSDVDARCLTSPTSELATCSGKQRDCPRAVVRFDDMPNEVLFNILGFLDVNDLLSTSRANHHLRHLSLAPILHAYRLRDARVLLPPLLGSRPPLADLIARSIFLTRTTIVSRQLGRSLVSIRLSRRLSARPPAEALVERAVLPPECVPGMSNVHVAPGLVAKRRAIEKERVKDGLRRWLDGVWKGEVMQREEGVRRWEEKRGVGRVWRLRRFWERMGRGENVF